MWWLALLLLWPAAGAAAAAAADRSCIAVDRSTMKCGVCPSAPTPGGVCADFGNTACFASFDVCCGDSPDQSGDQCSFTGGTSVTPVQMLVDDGSTRDVILVENMALPLPAVETDQVSCVTHMMPAAGVPSGAGGCSIGGYSLEACQSTCANANADTIAGCSDGSDYVWWAWYATAGNQGACFLLSEKWLTAQVSVIFDAAYVSDPSLCLNPWMHDYDACTNQTCLICDGLPRCAIPYGQVLTGPINCLADSTKDVTTEMCKYAPPPVPVEATSTQMVTTEETTEEPTTAAEETTEEPTTAAEETTEEPTTAAEETTEETATTAEETTEEPTTAADETTEETATTAEETTAEETSTVAVDTSTVTSSSNGQGTTSSSDSGGGGSSTNGAYTDGGDDAMSSKEKGIIGGIAGGIVLIGICVAWWVTHHYTKRHDLTQYSFDIVQGAN